MWSDNTPTPSYVIDEARLKKNLAILHDVEQRSGCHILLAQKAFAPFSLYPLIGNYISGTTASGLFEARLSHEYMKKQNHVFSPAYKLKDIEELAMICDHVVFNSISQYKSFHDNVSRISDGKCSIGLRINPECSTQKTAIYNPCTPGSRMGVTYKEFLHGFEDLPCKDSVIQLPSDIEGFHFHTLSEQNADALITTFKAFEEKFAPYLSQVKWLNMGGGHQITDPSYDIEALIDLITFVKDAYDIEIYLEPGEAIGLNAGYLVCEVCDIVYNDITTLVLDTSAACHMPDVLEMPYRPPLRNSFEPEKTPYTYRLSSCTCLSGDIIGDYSFDHEIRIGERLIFEDMAIYTMVKNNTFNGICLPSIYLLHNNGETELIKEFGYEDFKSRLS